MAFSSIPLPQYENSSDKTVNTLLKMLSSSGDIASQLEQAKQIEFQNQLAKSQEERVNKLFPEQLQKAKMENQLYIPKTQADINYKTANTNRLNFQQQNPLYGQAGAAGQIGAAELLRQHPELISDPNAANQIMNALNTSILSKNASADINTKRSQGYDFNSLPVQNKSYLIAQAGGLGIEPNEAVSRFNNGETINQMAESQGFDKNHLPDPVYALTTQGQNQLKQRQIKLNELKSLDEIIGKWGGMYTSKIKNMPIGLVKDQLLGKNKDKQIKFLAARVLATEGAGLRLGSLGANVGIEAIKHLTDVSMNDSDIPQLNLSSDVYQGVQDLVSNTIYDIAQKANSEATRAVSRNNNKNTSVKNSIEKEANEFKNETINMIGPDGNSYNVPTGKAQLFIRNGYKRNG